MTFFFIIILITVLILLAIQIVALIRIRSLIKQFKKTLTLLNNTFGQLQKINTYPDSLKRCQFCKYRKSFINDPGSEQSNDFYYRCGVDEKPISLNHTCINFKPESYYLDKTKLR